MHMGGSKRVFCNGNAGTYTRIRSTQGTVMNESLHKQPSMLHTLTACIYNRLQKIS